VLLAAAALAVWAPAAVAVSIDYTISGTTVSPGWYRSAVTVTWFVDGKGPPNQCGSSPVILTFDTLGQTVTCSFVDGTGSHSAGTNPIKIDQTPPTASVAAERSPDSAGIYSRPVTVTWSGTDATSGIAACTAIPYAGPDGIAVSLTGTCRDNAGNISAPVSFILNYDATPPALTDVRARPDDRGAKLSWQTDGASRIVVTRDGAVVYDGAGPGFVDRGLKNGKRYAYVVQAFDPAGNVATASVTVRPSAAASTEHLLSPGFQSLVRRPPLLRWREIRRASYYNVQLFRKGRKVLSAWPTKAHYQLRKKWRYHGRRHRLLPGTYWWYLWAGYGHRSEHRYGKLLGRRSFTVA
jgi:hypothetical protein